MINKVWKYYLKRCVVIRVLKKNNVINLKEKKDEFLEREKTKKMMTDSYIYEEEIINNEIARLRKEFGLNKKGEKKWVQKN